MANLRLIQIKATDSRTIKTSWTDKLDLSINNSNITIEPITASLPIPEVLKIDIKDNLLTITSMPLTPGATYTITFKSTNLITFKSLNGTAILLEDGQTNVKSIIGPEEPANYIRDNLISYLKDNIYNLDHGTLVRTILDQIASNMLTARNSIKQAKNDNYLKIRIDNERKIRGKGPFDRLNEEGAFNLIRVSKTKENTTLSTSLSYTSFPTDPITLLRTDVSDEVLTAGSGDGTFNSLLLTAKNRPVSKLTSVVILYQDGTTFTYDLSTYGYQIKDSRYDTLLGSTDNTLNDNQFKLSDEIFNITNFNIPGVGDTIEISYEYKSLGRIIQSNTVQVAQILQATREPTPPLLNEFFLENAPIVTSNDVIPSTNGVQFLDPSSSTPFLTTHPAFETEIPFRIGGLPKAPGEYSIDYETGHVFVYGATSDNDGTGNFPPAATYKYRKVFTSGLDYIFNTDSNELVASPIRDLAGLTAKITFDYESVLVPGVDFDAALHTEVIDERIENRLRNSNSLTTINTPITNVFRIFNETSGEIYTMTRFIDNIIYFNSIVPPKIVDVGRERGTFHSVLNELLITNTELTNSLGVRAFKILLNNNNIISGTEDVIGSSFNSSVIFSRNDIFVQELYFDGQVLSETANINRLTIGSYQVDYRNGIVYVGVSSSQEYDIGTISYKRPVLSPVNPHLISVSEIYYSLEQSVSKLLNYDSFDEGEITPTSLDVSDERFLNGSSTAPYVIDNNTITVTDDIKSIRHIFDVYDLNNNSIPTDFGAAATFSANVITLDSLGVEKNETLIVDSGLTINVTLISPGVEIGQVSSIIRLSDNQELLDGYETIIGNVITLAGSSGAIVGDVVNVIYTVVLNSSATPVVDYDRGGLYIDYTYLADEILVSYEYGDNVIDFRNSNSINEGEEYFVSYEAGALRDALLNNFGSLVNLPELQVFEPDLDREIYRNALKGALQSFSQGPTIPAIKALVSNITKIDPEIIEAIFTVWSLGISKLFKEKFTVHGEPTLIAGKFDQGVYINDNTQAISFPVSSNLRIEEGTLQFWITPDWNGLDNDATLTIYDLKKDNVAILASSIFIGSSSYNPTINDLGEFTISRFDDNDPAGLPTAIYTQQSGVFIYYDTDQSRWKLLVKDTPQDGYDGYAYSGKILSSGEFYHVKHIDDLGEPDDILRTTKNKIEFILNLDGYDRTSLDGYTTGDGYLPPYSFDGVTFMADEQHYLFDFANNTNKNRFSLFKDGSGYLNFQIWDKGGRLPNKPTSRNVYTVSADIQNWLAGEKHNIAITWKLNTTSKRDEMHLFIDGFEQPNIMRYGGRPIVTTSDRFREVKPEIVVGTVPLTIVVGDDLQTTQGSNIVVSDNRDFSALGITAGATIRIDEIGFSTYNVLTVVDNILTLDANMPATLSDAKFSVNPYSVIVESSIDLYANIAVSILHAGVETEIAGIRADLPSYEISKNALNQNVLTILGDAEAGDSILIRTLGLNHRRAKERVYLWGAQSVLKTHLPPPINLDEVSIKAILLPLTPIGNDNATLVGDNFVANLTTTQPTNSTEGRKLSVRITGGNVDFSTATSVTINGNTSSGPIAEALTFSAAGTQTTSNKFISISSIDVVTKPITSLKNGTAIEISEAYSLTIPDGNNDYPVIRYVFKTGAGSNLSGDGSDVLTDTNGFFGLSDVDNLLVISSPGSVAGTYTITERIDSNSIRVTPTPPVLFSDGVYDIYSINIGRSGFQNGFFFLQTAGSATDPYEIPAGVYEFDYSAYLEIPFDPINQTAYIGNDFTLTKPAKAVIDEFRILSEALTDTRIGESLATNAESITTGYQAIAPFIKKTNTLVLLHFEELPPENDVDYYTFANREYIQSGTSINSNFSQSVVFNNKGLQFYNDGRLTTNNEGSIEFWISPSFDTYNDPNIRFYFDGTSAVVEESTSITKGTAKTSGKTTQVLSVRLATDTQNTGINYFNGGTISSDRQTLNLGIPLPFQQTPVKITYLPSGVKGDRISIYKDSTGFLTFNVRAKNNDYQLKQPIFWSRDSWHRVRATFKFNRTDNQDEIRLFVDGEERGVILFGSGLIFGDGTVFGQGSVTGQSQAITADINFTDIINHFYIGQDFEGSYGAYAKMDNLRLSNIAREPLTIAGQLFDVNFSSNIDVIYPVIEDAFTTFLMDFDRLVEKFDDFSELRDAEFGIFNFTMNIIDSFGIVEDDVRIREVLESMILALKPATAKVQINYV